jgi:hypothetical protein
VRVAVSATGANAARGRYCSAFIQLGICARFAARDGRTKVSTCRRSEGVPVPAPRVIQKSARQHTPTVLLQRTYHTGTTHLDTASLLDATSYLMVALWGKKSQAVVLGGQCGLIWRGMRRWEWGEKRHWLGSPLRVCEGQSA